MTVVWPTVELASVASVLSGFAFDSNNFSDEAGIPLVRIRDVTRGWSDTFFRGDFDSRFIVRDGDLLVGMDGQFNRELWRGGEALLNQRVCRVTADGLKLDQRYLYHFLPRALKSIEDETPYVTVKHLSTPKIRGIRIPLPPLSEQKRIAAILDQAEGLRTKRRAALAKLDSLTQATFIDMFGSPSANPKGYPVATMIELVDPRRPITYGILKPGQDVPDGVPYVRVVDMTDRSIHRAGLRRTTEAISSQYKRSLLREGDLLLSIRGHVGRLAMVEADVAGANITQDTARLAITGANPIYVLECLRSPELQRWMKTFTKGAAVRGINLTDVKRIELPLPPASDQSRFARTADDIQRNRQSLLASAGELDLLFASLQHRAFQGEL